MNIQEITTFYKKGHSLTKTGEEFNLSPYMVKKYLQDNKATIRSRHEQNILSNQQRSKKVDDNFFKEISSREQASILGFFAADWNVSSTRNLMTINLSAKDIELLHKIKFTMQIEKSVTVYQNKDGYEVAQLCWSSCQQKKDLAKYDIVPRKSYSKISLNNIPSNCRLDYLLGYYDGDGCFRNDGQYCRIEVCSYTPFLLDEVANLISVEFGFSKNVYKSKTRDNYYTLTYSTGEADKILDTLYHRNTLFLKRKYNLYQEWLKQNDRI